MSTSDKERLVVHRLDQQRRTTKLWHCPTRINCDFGIGQVYSQEVIKQIHLEISTRITILTIFITPGQVICKNLARLTQAKARQYIASNLHLGPLENRSVDNGTALWWEEDGLEVVELMGHDPLFTHFRYEPPNELYVFVQHVNSVPDALSEFVFLGRFYRTTSANIQDQSPVAAMYQSNMATLPYKLLWVGMQIFLAFQVMLAQESAPAVQAQTSVDTTASNVSDDETSNGEPAHAVAEFEFDTDDSTVIDEPPLNGGELFSSDGQLVRKADFALDNSDVDTSDSEDSEDYLESDMDSEDCFLNLLENPTNDFVTDDDRIKAVYRAAHRSLFR